MISRQDKVRKEFDRKHLGNYQSVNFVLDICASGDRYMNNPGPSAPPPNVCVSAHEQRFRTAEYARKIEEAFKKKKIIGELSDNDTLSWKSSLDSPACEACHWVFERPVK